MPYTITYRLPTYAYHGTVVSVSGHRHCRDAREHWREHISRRRSKHPFVFITTRPIKALCFVASTRPIFMLAGSLHSKAMRFANWSAGPVKQWQRGGASVVCTCKILKYYPFQNFNMETAKNVMHAIHWAKPIGHVTIEILAMWPGNRVVKHREVRCLRLGNKASLL